jgi:phage tail-like protein
MSRFLRFDPYIGCNFWVLSTAFIIGGFREVSGLEGTVKMTPYAEGGRNGYSHQFPGVVEWPNLVLSRGVIDSNAMWSWFEDVSKGKIDRKTLILMMLDRAGLPAMFWTVKKALPVKWTGPKLDATSDQVAVESLELVHRGIEKPLASKALTLLRAADDIAQALSPPYVDKRKAGLDAANAGVNKVTT